MYYVWDKVSIDRYSTHHYESQANIAMQGLIARGERTADQLYVHEYKDSHEFNVANNYLRDGTWDKPVWATQPWAKEAFWKLGVVPHVNAEKPDLIRFFPDNEKLAKFRPTEIKPGRYLKQFHGDVLSSDEITMWADKHKEQYLSEATLSWANTPEHIAMIYSSPSVFGSCMAHTLEFDGLGNRHWTQPQWPEDLPFHPSAAYGAGDLSLAYIHKGDRILARALVWREKMLVGRVYGDGATLRKALSNEGIETQSTGYQYDSLAGAKILKLPFFPSEKTKEKNKNGSYAFLANDNIPKYVAPYLDGDNVYGVDIPDDTDHFKLITIAELKEIPNVSYAYFQQANGTAAGSVGCACCGKQVSNPYAMLSKVDEENTEILVCNTCLSVRGLYSSHSEAYVDSQYFSRVNYYRDGPYGERAFSAIADLDPIEQINGTWYLSADVTTLSGGDRWPAYLRHRTFESEVDGKVYPTHMMKYFGTSRVTTSQAEELRAGNILLPVRREPIPTIPLTAEQANRLLNNDYLFYTGQSYNG